MLGVAILLLASTVVFWKLRIVDLGTNPRIEIGPIDLYIEHIPMVTYAFDTLAAGKLPLWNPYQLCGQPFLAVPHTALLYPLHAFGLFLDASVSVEITFVLHMFLGGLGMWWLARRMDLPMPAAFAAAFTFMWSGWIVFTNVVPGIHASLSWLPLTIVLLDRAVDRARFALPALIAAVGCQILLGATEVLLHTLLLGAAFTAVRLSQLVLQGAAGRAVERGLAILGSLVAAALLAAPQLLPTLELVAHSGRASEPVGFEAAAVGAIAPLPFLEGMLGATGLVSVGIVPFLALPLALGLQRRRFAWAFGLGAVVVGALLVFGGVVYEAYHSIPVIGSLFRRPVKFLDVYAFGQALLAGVAIAELHRMASTPRSDLWRNPRWLLCVGLAIAAFAASGLAQSSPDLYWGACLLGLLAFGLVRGAGIRSACVLGFVVLQAASCFFRVGETHMRPFERPEIYHAHDSLLASLQNRAPHQRVHLSSSFTADPSLTAKQGLLSHLRVTTDYEPLSSRRSQRFFDRVTPGDQDKRMNPFAGIYSLTAESRWHMMDLTATRYYVMSSAEPAARFMLSRAAAFEPVAAGPGLRVFERPSALPRAYLVAEARVLDSEDEVLERLASPGFDPRRRVLLEGGAPMSRPPTQATGIGRVAFVHDEPERLVIDVEAERPAWLVLSDAFYPGWRAFVDDREVEIQRANYLFRAIELEAGTQTVRFEYAPRSLRLGVGLSLATAVVLVVSLGLRWRRARAAT